MMEMASDVSRLEAAEGHLAALIETVAGKAASHLRSHDRSAASVLLAQLAGVAANGHKAMVSALRE